MEYDNGHQYYWNQVHFQDILVSVIGKQMFSSQLSVIPKFLFLGESASNSHDST